MATPETVVDYAAAELAARDSARQAAEAALAAAHADLDLRLRQLRQIAAQLSDREAEAADLRRRLALAPNPADAAALLEQLEAVLIVLRSRGAALIDAQFAAAAAQAAADRAATNREREDAGFSAIRSVLAAAHLAADRRQAWDAQAALLAQAPTLKSRAAAVAGSADFTAAKARVESEIPAKLRTRGRSLAQTALADLQSSVSAVTSAAATLTADQAAAGLGGTVAAKERAFAAAEAVLRDLALGAEPELALAQGSLGEILAAPPLSAAVIQRIQDRATAGGTAVDDLPTKVADLAQARADVAAQEALIAAKTLELEADPGNPVLEAELQQLKDDLLPLEQAVLDLEDEIEDLHGDLDLWEVAVPEDAWQRLYAFDEAARRLDRLQTFDAAAITAVRDAVKTAEKDFAAALVAAAANAHQTGQHAADLELAERRRAAAFETRRERLLAGLRGDR